MFQAAYAMAYASREGLELHTNQWIGTDLFGISHPRYTGREDVSLSGYFQDQDALIYTRSQVKQWFKFKKPMDVPSLPCVAHRRVGDFRTTPGYVVVSEESYFRACEQYQLPEPEFVTEEKPRKSFVEDFQVMMNAKVLLRGNSSFSWWAATLGNAQVYSPLIDGLPDGERDVDFVPGNAPRISNHSFVTDLHLKE